VLRQQTILTVESISLCVNGNAKQFKIIKMAKVKKIAKAENGYRGGCVATTAGADRAERKEGRVANREYKKAIRVANREERKEVRAEKKAAKAAPAAKHGKSVVKKAKDGQQVPSEMKPGKMIKKADRDARADSMVKSLDKASVLGKNYVAPSDSTKKKRPMGMNFDKKSFDKVPSFDKYIKKTENKKVAPKKKMMNGGKAKKMMSGGKCKYGC